MAAERESPELQCFGSLYDRGPSKMGMITTCLPTNTYHGRDCQVWALHTERRGTASTRQPWPDMVYDLWEIEG